MKRFQQGFTLIEMLVSVVIFSIVMIGVYYFFDSGKWLYLHSENRANMQENGRLAMEGMEREMRMIGFGIPSGTQINDNISWNPPIIYGDDNQIGFRGDINSYNSLPKDQPADTIASGASVISVDWPEFICPQDNTPILIVQRGRNWQSTTCTGRTSTAINISPGAIQSFLVSETELFAPSQVYYRFTPDTDGDSICDEATATVPDYTQCKIERAEIKNLLPQIAPADSDWETYATNVRQLKFRYFRKNSIGYTELTAPLGIQTASVDMIRLEITVMDRMKGERAQLYQSSEFRTEVLIRKHRY